MDQGMETVDLRYYISILQKWRLVIAVVTIVSVLVSWFISFFVLPPVYETKATLMVTQANMQRMNQYQPDDLRSAVSIVSRLPEMTINTYVGQLTSPYFMSRIIEKAKLDKDLYSPSGLASMIQARAIKDTNLIEITVSNNSPKLATDIANTVSTDFIEFITENLQQQMAKSVRFLEDQAAAADKDLKKANEQLHQVQVGPRGVEFLDRDLKTKSAAMSEQQTLLLKVKVEGDSLAAGLSKISEQLSSVPQYIKSKESGTQPIQEWNPAYRQLEQQLRDKKTQLQEKKAYVETRGADDYTPYTDVAKVQIEVQMLTAGIAVLEKELAETPKLVVLPSGGQSSEQVLNPLWQSLVQQENEKSVALAESQALRAGLEASIGTLSNEINELQKQLAEKRTDEYRLQKQVSQLEQAYSLLKEKVIQTEMTRSLDIGDANIAIIAPALQPRLPVRPRKMLNIAVAAVLGLMVSVAAAFVLEYADYTIKTSDDVLRHLGVPSLGSVPVISSQRKTSAKPASTT